MGEGLRGIEAGLLESAVRHVRAVGAGRLEESVLGAGVECGLVQGMGMSVMDRVTSTWGFLVRKSKLSLGHQVSRGADDLGSISKSDQGIQRGYLGW